MITDEMVEKAWLIVSEEPGDIPTHDAVRAALEAVAPMIIAQWLREESSKYIVELGMIFHARAQELDPK